MKYLINADDYGRSPYTNKAISEGFENGLLDRTSIIVNKDFLNEAVEMAKEKSFFDKIGLHFNLIDGFPLTDEIRSIASFCDEKGKFNGKIFKSRRIKLFLFPSEIRAVYKELNAQIDKFFLNGFTLMHFDSHGHIHTFPSLVFICLFVISKRGFKSVRLSLNYSAKGIKRFFKIIVNLFLNGLNKKNGRKVKYFDSVQEAIKSFEKIKGEKGIFEVMVHPDYRDRIHAQIETDCYYPDLYIFEEYRVNSHSKEEDAINDEPVE